MASKSKAMPKECVMPIRDENSITCIQDRLERFLVESGEDPPHFPDQYDRAAKALGIDIEALIKQDE